MKTFEFRRPDGVVQMRSELPDNAVLKDIHVPEGLTVHEVKPAQAPAALKPVGRAP